MVKQIILATLLAAAPAVQAITPDIGSLSDSATTPMDDRGDSAPNSGYTSIDIDEFTTEYYTADEPITEVAPSSNNNVHITVQTEQTKSAQTPTKKEKKSKSWWKRALNSVSNIFTASDPQELNEQPIHSDSSFVQVPSQTEDQRVTSNNDVDANSSSESHPSVQQPTPASTETPTVQPAQPTSQAPTADTPTPSQPSEKISSGFQWTTFFKYGGGLAFVAGLTYLLIKQFSKQDASETIEEHTAANLSTDPDLVRQYAMLREYNHDVKILSQLLKAAQIKASNLMDLFNQAKPHLKLVDETELKVLEIYIEEKRFDDVVTFIVTNLAANTLQPRAQQLFAA